MISIKNFCNRHYGRFGNQLFQYSLAKILSAHHNCSFFLNPSDHFVSFFDTKYLTYKALDKPLVTTSYVEHDPYGFDADIFHHKNIDLIGFFQHFDYYKDQLSILNTEYKPNDQILSETIQFLQHKTNYNLDLDKTVCIHLRRTDYTILQHKYDLLDLTYFLNIIDNYNIEYNNIFIITDDPNSAKNELQQIQHKHKIQIVTELDVYHHFYIMYLCRINLISNSTFSWWAALLSNLQYKNKDVYTPYPWLKSSSHIELYPCNWKTISINTFKWKKLFT